MATITQISRLQSLKLELKSAFGPVYRDVLPTPPREATEDEIPVIDISGVRGDLAARKALARRIRHAAENTGFFYIKNHGISEGIISDALNSSKAFFAQPEEKKQLVSKSRGKYFTGYSRKATASVNPSEGLDYRESFVWRYDPKYDPDPKDVNNVPEEIKPWIRGEEYVWEDTAQIPGFKQGCITYWQECLKLSRELVRIFALALELPEDYFDAITTYPGSDGVFNYYPATSEDQTADSSDRGLGSHTDLQCFTLLWQDMSGGLQVLSNDGQWIRAEPIPGTFVVNIGDYLMRLTNDRFKSTVHRVYNHSTVDRYSMPFFFGFNFNETCGVLPNCTDEAHPAKYEPVSCGDWCQTRFAQMYAESQRALLQK